MKDADTFGGSDTNNYLDPLYRKQQEGVAKMRTSLLACTEENGVTMRHAIQNITAMRIYHQLTRIIKYTEVMDELENKLYESIHETVHRSNSVDPTTWMALLNIQERLQKSMIESHKMLQPYLDLQEFSMVDLMNTAEEERPAAIAMNSASRDRLRNSAQNVLRVLKTGTDG